MQVVTKEAHRVLRETKAQLAKDAGFKRWHPTFFARRVLNVYGYKVNLVAFDRLISAFKHTGVESFTLYQDGDVGVKIIIESGEYTLFK